MEHGLVPEEFGGDTMFASMYAAYNALPESLKQRIEGKMGAYVYGGRRKNTALLNPEDRNKAPVLAATMLMVVLITSLALTLYSKAQIDIALADRTNAFHQLEAEQKRTDDARRLFEAPIVVVAHGTEADPILNYANRTALELWETTVEALCRMPSRLTAEAPERAERERLLARTTRDGFVDDYRGVRISTTGRRFEIDRAIVWNLQDCSGRRTGQAATFAAWRFLKAVGRGQ